MGLRLICRVVGKQEGWDIGFLVAYVDIHHTLSERLIDCAIQVKWLLYSVVNIEPPVISLGPIILLLHIRERVDLLLLWLQGEVKALEHLAVRCLELLLHDHLLLPKDLLPLLFGEVFGIIVQADLLECKTLLINLGLLLRKHGFLGLIVVGVRTVQQGLVQHAAVDQGEVEGLLLLGLLLGP